MGDKIVGGYVPTTPLDYDNLPKVQPRAVANKREQALHNFTYHAPRPDQVPLYNSIRAGALTLATHILDSTPESREQSLALTKLEEAVMWANASIARHG